MSRVVPVFFNFFQNLSLKSKKKCSFPFVSCFFLWISDYLLLTHTHIILYLHTVEHNITVVDLCSNLPLHLGYVNSYIILEIIFISSLSVTTNKISATRRPQKLLNSMKRMSRNMYYNRYNTFLTYLWVQTYLQAVTFVGGL